MRAKDNDSDGGDRSSRSQAQSSVTDTSADGCRCRGSETHACIRQGRCAAYYMRIKFHNVRVPESNIILGGAGALKFRRGAGPGRIHHCSSNRSR